MPSEWRLNSRWFYCCMSHNNPASAHSERKVKVQSAVGLVRPARLGVTTHRNPGRTQSVSFSTRGEDSSAPQTLPQRLMSTLTARRSTSQVWRKSEHPLTERSATDCVLNMYQGHLQVRRQSLFTVSSRGTAVVVIEWTDENVAHFFMHPSSCQGHFTQGPEVITVQLKASLRPTHCTLTCVRV